MTICSVCKVEILNEEDEIWTGERLIHKSCKERIEDEILESQKFGKKEKSINVEDDNTGSVITDIRLPFERVLTITFQFFIAGLIIAIPLWIILILIAS